MCVEGGHPSKEGPPVLFISVTAHRIQVGGPGGPPGGASPALCSPQLAKEAEVINPGCVGRIAKSNPNKVRLEWNCKYFVLLAQVAATLRARGAESKGSAADALVGETRGLELPR